MNQETTNRSFDDLARGLANGSVSRGRALKLMGAALVGGTLASLGIGEAAADPTGCKRNGKACKSDTQCCSDNCANGTCAEPVPGTLFVCYCRDTVLEACYPAGCTSENIPIACVQLCANHGGTETGGGECSGVPC